MAASPGVSAQAEQIYLNQAAALDRIAKNLPDTAPTQEKPITLGVGEPFTTTLTVAVLATTFVLVLLLMRDHPADVGLPAYGETSVNKAPKQKSWIES